MSQEQITGPANYRPVVYTTQVPYTYPQNYNIYSQGYSPTPYYGYHHYHPYAYGGYGGHGGYHQGYNYGYHHGPGGKY